MKNTLKKVFNMGLGAYEISRKQVQKVAAELEKEGHMSKSEAKSFVNEVIDDADKAAKELQVKVKKEVDIAVKSSVDALQKVLDDVKKKSSAPKKKKATKRKVAKKKPAKKKVSKKRVTKKKKR